MNARLVVLKPDCRLMGLVGLVGRDKERQN
jgi:hypothetical protein